MKAFAKKSGRIFIQATLSLIAFSIVLLAVLQIGLMIGFSLFNTGKGRDVIQAQLQKSLAQSGYEVSLGALFYDPVRGLNIYDVDVRDENGSLAMLDRLSVGVVLEKLFLKDLELFVSGGTLTLHRLPSSAQEPEDVPEKAPLLPFSLPDIYFKRIALDFLNFDRIAISESIAGRNLIFSPRLRAEILLEDEARLTASFQPNASENLKALQIPEKITLEAAFASQSLDILVKELLVDGDAYQLVLEGQGNLQENGLLDFTVKANHSGLDALTSNQFSSAQIDAALKGTASSPALTAKGIVQTQLMKDRGLDDIVFAITGTDLANSPQISATVDTAYQEQTVHLETDVTYQSPHIAINGLTLTAPHAKIDGTGHYDLQSSLADITLQIGIENLAHYSALAGFDLAGTLKSTITLSPSEGGEQALRTTSRLENGQYDTFKVRSIDANIFFSNIFAGYWPQAADIKISRFNLDKDISLQNAALTLKQADGQNYNLSLNGNGTIPEKLSFKGGAIIESFSPPIPSVQNIDLAINLARSSATLSGGINAENVDLRLTTKDFRLADLPGNLPRNLRRVLMNGGIAMTGTPAAPVTKADIKISGLNTGKYDGLGIDITAAHENGSATLDVNGRGTGIRTLSADASFPLAFALSPFAFSFDQNAALAGDINADLDLSPIASLFLQPTQIVSGAAAIKGTLSGTLSSPDIQGTAAITDGGFLDEGNGIELAALQANATFTQDRVQISSLSGTDGENGTLSGKGTISFGQSGTDLSLAMNNFHVPKSNMANGFLNADISFADSGTAYEAIGRIDIQSMDILIPETFQSSIPELNIVERGEEDSDNAGKSLLLDIDVVADNQFFVRGWGLDAEFGGNIDINGTADKPLFDGAFSARRGRYEEFGKRFDLARADLRFQGTIPPSPYLDIEATTNAEDVVASVLLTGSIQQPAIAFSSVPSLPQDEVLARILFGKSATKISPFQAIQLAQTVQRFSGQGGSGLDPLGTLRQLTGLDDVSVETDSEGQTNVGVGKYLTDNVYLEFERGSAEDSGAANLQIEVTPNVTIESEIGQDTQGGGGVFWKYDY